MLRFGWTLRMPMRPISSYWFKTFGMVNQPIGSHKLGIFWYGQI